MIYLLIVVILYILIVGIFLIKRSWFPQCPLFRIMKKTNGTITLYRAEFSRPFFGWNGFWAGRYSASVHLSDTWSMNKKECEEYINIYKELKDNGFSKPEVENI